jgi:3-dehydroquinate synthase
MISTTSERIEVNLASRSYPIVIETGLLARVGAQARELLSPRCRQAAIVSNARVYRHYGEMVCASLTAAGLRTVHILIGDGERFKTLRAAEKIYTFLIEQGIERNDCIFALGGGVVGDLAGFVAATYLRGINFIQLPTTLLAQIDAAIGGKTGVDHPLGKNLIGAFHQPKMVAIDPQTLSTLPRRELSAAMQEAIKYGIIADAELFQLIAANIKQLLNGKDQLLHELITRCCRIKAGVVSRDELESGERRILNFGHTIGHALEAATNYRRFKHGEAVGYGIMGAARIATKLSLLSNNEAERIRLAVRACGRLPAISDIDADRVFQCMQKDKKAIAGNIVFVLPDRIGHVIIREAVPITTIKQAILETLNEEEAYE